MLNLNLNTKDYFKSIDINISLGNNSLDGGIYIFLIDGIPLYIGESYYFLERLSYHLGNLNSNISYFGLEKLYKFHEITYGILKQGLPFHRKINPNGRDGDFNKVAREKEEAKCIETYYPLTQRPIFLNTNQIIDIFKKNDEYNGNKYTKRKYDCMLPEDERNQFVADCFTNHFSEYDEIKKLIKEKLI